MQATVRFQVLSGAACRKDSGAATLMLYRSHEFPALMAFWRLVFVFAATGFCNTSSCCSAKPISLWPLHQRTDDGTHIAAVNEQSRAQIHLLSTTVRHTDNLM